MKYLGIDYGSKWVGVAVSDEEGKIAFPRAEVANDAKLLPFLTKMIEQDKIEKIVIGDTRAVSGAENPVTREAEAFIVALTKASAIPVEKIWEVWSSVEASRYSENIGDHNNASAAAIILQRYLDMNIKK